MSNGLGGDAFTRNIIAVRTHAYTHTGTYTHMDRLAIDRLWYESNIPFFLKKKERITTQEDTQSLRTILLYCMLLWLWHKSSVKSV